MLDESYLLEKVKEYAASPEGRKRIKEQTGIDYDPSKDKSNWLNDMLVYAEQMRMILWRHINKSVKSVTKDDIIIETPVKDEKGVISISLSFRPGSMFRPSLDPEEYPEGIQNIVLHFTHGWSARRPIRGEWHGTEVWSRVTRRGSSFMQDAVNEFNAKGNGIATAELSADYK